MHIHDYRQDRITGSLESRMKTPSLVVALVMAASFTAAPALAKTSISKSLQVCKTAAQSQQPAPKSVVVDKSSVRSSDATITVKLRVKQTDDTSVDLVCAVDRATAETTLTPAS
jgi:hypothetical protein